MASCSREKLRMMALKIKKKERKESKDMMRLLKITLELVRHRAGNITWGVSDDRGKSGLPFMMYSFSAEPGRASALNKLLSSCSVKGAISAAVILAQIQRG